MTAPAVVRRWEQRPRPSTGCPANDGGAPVERRRGEARVRLAAHDQLAIVSRLAPFASVWLTTVAARAALAPHLSVRGVEPDVLLVAVVAVAAGRGARAGAAFGFAAGLGADLFLATPLAASALAYTLVGHVVGRSSRPRPALSAAALCSPTSTCFACRTGRRHAAGPNDDAPSGDRTASRPARRQRRIMIRRAALRGALAVTGAAVAGGQIGTATVVTALAGLPFPRTAGLAHIAGVAVLSAPLGIPALAAGRRFGRGQEVRR